MLRSFLISSIVVVVAAACAAPPRPAHEASAAKPVTAPAAARLDTLLRDAVTTEHFPGLVFGVVRDDKTVFQGAYGVANRTTGQAIGVDTAFRIGSITKTFAALAVLSLRDEGKLSLTDPLEKYLPEAAAIVYPNGAADPRITLEQILSHRSGMPRLGSVDYTRGDHDVTESEILADLKGLKLESVPGTTEVYSNLAVGYLGIVVSRVSGEGFHSYVQRRILTPLGMTHAAWWDRDVAANLAEGHVLANSAVVPGPAHWRFGAMDSAGGLYASLEEMLKFTRFNLTGHAVGGPPVALGTLREAQRRHLGDEPDGTGYAFQIRESPRLGHVVWHNGSTGDYSASMFVAVDKGVGVVAMTNVGASPSLDRLVMNLLPKIVSGEVRCD